MTAVFASPHGGDREFVRSLFGEAGWKLIETESCTKTLVELKRHPVDLVIADRDVAGGGWRILLGAVTRMPSGPPLIVTSRLADERLWAQVLHEGGYDILVQPFEREEVVRVVSAATRHRRNQEARRAAPRPKTFTAGI
ncbi:MAG: two-component system response regulator [Bryobacteraceae bacterium]